MKTIAKLTLVLLVLFAFQSCSKDDAPTPEPIAQPEPEPEPENQAPTQVSLLSPAADAENIDVRPTFSWEAATDPDGDAITYEIYADTTATPATLIGTTNETSFELEERLSLLENYSWKVIAKDNKEGESESVNQTFNTRTVITSIATNSAEFGRRGGHSSAVFNNKVWVIGGRLVDENGSTADTNEVWNSDDGIRWSLVTASASFAPRHLHSSLVYDNKIWVFGGVVGSEISKEIWNSNDGVTWNLVSDTITPDPFNNGVVVFDNKLWLINDSVWFSDDGVVWSLAYSETRIDGSTTVYDGKIWVMDGSFRLNVHYSEDGFNWTSLEENTSELFANKTEHHIYEFDNKLWNVGGFDNDILFTTNGIDWKVASQSPAFPSLFSTTTEIKDDKVWVIGGYSTGSNNAQDSVYFID